MWKGIKWITCGIVAISIVMIFMGVSFAATYYVATDGNNGNPGTSSQPWRTPAYGASRLSPGDTLIIRSGTYVLSSYETDILRPPSGIATAWVTIKGENGGTVVLAGRDDLAFAVELGGRSYVRLENLEITHDPNATGTAIYFREGISITGSPASHMVFKDLHIHHLDEFGVDAQDVDDLQILNCRIEYCGFGAVGGPAGTAGGLKNITIQNSSLSWSGHYYQGGDGSNRPYDRPDGFGIEPSDGPILIEDTILEHNYGDGLDSKAKNTTIRRCIVANNSCDGVKLWGPGSVVENTLIYGRGDGNSEPTPWGAIVIDTTETTGGTFSLLNVTVDDQLGGNYLMYVQYDDAVNITLDMKNCIFSGRGPDCPIWLRDTVTLNADHNLFWFPQLQNDTILEHGDATYTAATISTLGTRNIYGNPLFVATAWGSDGNYHLRSESPAIDAGITLTDITDDLDGKSRPLGNGYDIGAYEFGNMTEILSLYPVTNAQCGQVSRLWAQVKNTGTTALPATAYVWYYVDGPDWSGNHFVGYTSVYGLAPNASQWYPYDWAIPESALAGSYNYWAIIYGERGTALSDWKGPQAFTVSCGGSIVSADVSSLYPVTGAQCGQTSRIWAQLKNSGTTALPDTAYVWYYVDGPDWSGNHFVGYTWVYGLAPNASQWYFYDWAIPEGASAGSYNYWARVYGEGGTAISDWKGPQAFTVSCR